MREFFSYHNAAAVNLLEGDDAITEATSDKREQETALFGEMSDSEAEVNDFRHP